MPINWQKEADLMEATSENELLQVCDDNHQPAHGTRALPAALGHLLGLLGKQVF